MIMRRKNPLADPLWQRALSMGLMILCSFVILLPFFLLALYSILPSGYVANLGGIAGLLKHATLEGYQDVFRMTPFVQMAVNSLWLATVQTIIQIVVAFLAAYAISRWDYPGRQYILNFVIATMLIPAISLMIPNYLTISRMKLVNNFGGVILPNIASGYAIFLMRQFFRTVPRSLVEAASLDNCNEFRILWNVYMPLTAPAIAALGIIRFVALWNDFEWPLLILTKDRLMTLPLALVRFKNEGMIDWMPTAAACLMTILPVFILYLLTQKQFVETFSASATKG